MSNLLPDWPSQGTAAQQRLPAQPSWVSSPEETDVRRLLGLLWRKKLQITVCTIITVLAALLATKLTTPLYRSVALLQFAPDSVNATPYSDPFEAMSGKGNYESYLRTQEALLMSSTIGDRVATYLESPSNELFAREIPYLYDRLSVQRLEGSQLFRIEYVAEAPESAAAITNMFARELIQEQMRAKRAARDQVIRSLRSELVQLEQRLQSSERELVQYATKNQITRLGTTPDGDPIQQRLTAIEANLIEAESQRIAARSQLDNLKADAGKGTLGESRVVADLNGRIRTLENELAALLTTFGERWPAVVAKKSEIAFVRRQLEEERAATHQQMVDDTQLEYEIAESRYNMIAASLREQRDNIGRYQRASIQYNILRREVETNQELYAGLLERLKQSTVMGELDTPNIQIVQHGKPDPIPDSPKLPLNVALSLVMGLGLGVSIVVVRDYWDRSISGLDELERTLDLPPLGVLPEVKREDLASLGGARNLLGSRTARKTKLLKGSGDAEDEAENARPGNDPRHTSLGEAEPELREAVIGICTSILLAQTDNPLRVIAITSALPGEGKTTVARLLGQALAESGGKTLLVDADLRISELSESYGGRKQDGLSLLLSGNSPQPAIQKTAVPNLCVLPSGPKPPNSVALLNSDAMTEFLKSAKSGFQYVVIDTPPVLGIADARVMSARVDGVVLVVRARKTRRDVIGRAWSLIGSSGGRGLGVVLNGADPKDIEFSVGYEDYR